ETRVEAEITVPYQCTGLPTAFVKYSPNIFATASQPSDDTNTNASKLSGNILKPPPHAQRAAARHARPPRETAPGIPRVHRPADDRLKRPRPVTPPLPARSSDAAVAKQPHPSH